MEPNWSLAANGILGLTGACLLLELWQGHTVGTILLRTGMFMAACSLGISLLLVLAKVLGRAPDKPADKSAGADRPRSDERQKQEKQGGKAR